MIGLYPWIEELFALVSKYIHEGSTPDNTIRYITQRDNRINERILKAHRQKLTDKLLQFAAAISDIKPESNQPAIYEQMRLTPAKPKAISNSEPALPVGPELCRHCGSIEVNGDECRWCGSALAG